MSTKIGTFCLFKSRQCAYNKASMSKELKSIDQQLLEKKYTRPNIFNYTILKIVARTVLTWKYHTKMIWKTDVRKVKGPFVLISNHASRADYLFNAIYFKERVNFVLGYNEFFRSHLSGTVNSINCIPKRNFQFEVKPIMAITEILKQGGVISIYPEGMNSISGANQPVAIGTGSFLKRLGAPVYYSVIKGGYLSCPKYDNNDRPGKVESVVDLMFTENDLEVMTPEEIEDRVNELLYHDDYEWNKIRKIHYKTKGKTAEGLETLLYWCPKCHKEFTMTTKGNDIVCSNCGNGATLDDTYEMHPFNKSSVIPDTQTKWFNMERANIKEEVKDPNFELRSKVKIGTLPKYELLKDKKTSEITGEGELVINHNGLTYRGTKEGKEVELHLDLNHLPSYGMCTDVTRFYTFFNNEFVEFYPEHNIVMKWFMATEELHRLHGGKWQDFKFDVNKMKSE